MKPSTYQHYEDPDRFKGRHLPLELTHALVRAASTMQADPAPVLAMGGLDETDLASIRGLSDIEITPYQPENAALNRRDAAVAAMLEGTKNIHPWLIRGRALTLAGYLPNDIVIVDHDRRDGRSGDVVVANLHDWSRDTARTIIRLFEPPYLIAACADTAYRKPILVDHEQVIIMGTVIASMRMLT